MPDHELSEAMAAMDESVDRMMLLRQKHASASETAVASKDVEDKSRRVRELLARLDPETDRPQTPPEST